MARQRVGRSLAEDAYTAIRERVLLGDLAPGTRLVLQDLSKELGVSLSVVREAVTRLATERLLVATPQHGFVVQPLSLGDLADITWTRVQIETIALREAIKNGDLAWEVNLVAAHHALQSTDPMGPDGRISPAWGTVHSRFHAALTAGANRPWLSNIRQQLFDASELYRYWSASRDVLAGPSRRIKAVQREHKALVDAAISRDSKRACELIAHHFESTAAILAKNPDATSQNQSDA